MEVETHQARWMTYAELAEARGISTRSATRLAFRRKWPRQAGNDGTARVSVPIGEDQPQPQTHADRDVDTDADRGDIRRLINALEAAIAASGDRAQADATTIEALADQVHGLRAELHEASTRADTVQAGYDQYRREVEAAEQARRATQDAQQAELDQLRQAEAVRQARGVLARFLAAWKGE